MNDHHNDFFAAPAAQEQTGRTATNAQIQVNSASGSALPRWVLPPRVVLSEHLSNSPLHRFGRPSAPLVIKRTELAAAPEVINLNAVDELTEAPRLDRLEEEEKIRLGAFGSSSTSLASRAAKAPAKPKEDSMDWVGSSATKSGEQVGLNRPDSKTSKGLVPPTAPKAMRMQQSAQNARRKEVEDKKVRLSSKANKQRSAGLSVYLELDDDDEKIAADEQMADASSIDPSPELEMLSPNGFSDADDEHEPFPKMSYAQRKKFGRRSQPSNSARRRPDAQSLVGDNVDNEVDPAQSVDDERTKRDAERRQKNVVKLDRLDEFRQGKDGFKFKGAHGRQAGNSKRNGR